MTSITAPQVYDATYAYIAEIASPPLALDNIIRGWQNRGSLPKDTNEFAVLTLMSIERKGSNVSEYDVDVYAETHSRLSVATFQIDFVSSDDSAMLRANALEIMARSGAGNAIFERNNCKVLYAEKVQGLTSIDGSNQYTQRYILTLRVSFIMAVNISVDSISSARVNIKNVDTAIGV